MRKGISTQAAGRIRGGKNPNIPIPFSNDKMEGNYMSSTGDDYNEKQTAQELMKSSTRGGPRGCDKKGKQMSSQVLETWINETLTDADHLDIPGVILKPEHKLPIERYGISKRELTTAGIPPDMVERIYRALFVYSVGFYELIKKCLEHTSKNVTIITAIWKVFSILLEYCCHTDYNMLITRI